MIKWIKSVGVLLLAVALFANVYAAPMNAETPSAKATAMVSELKLIPWRADNFKWDTILSGQLKTANQKDLFVDVSLQTGLYTRTLVRSKEMTKDTSAATAGIKVRVLVDGQEAKPGKVMFDKRVQELSATLQGQVDLIDQNDNDIIEEGELVIVAEEEIELLLSTLGAHSFNFVLPGVTAGNHTIEVQAQIVLGSSAQLGEAEAKAMIGKGSVTIEEVRMIQGNEAAPEIIVP